MTKKLEIKEFMGGLNTFMAAHLIANNQATELTNIDVSRGYLVPETLGRYTTVETTTVPKLKPWIDKPVSEALNSIIEYPQLVFSAGKAYTISYDTIASSEGYEFTDAGNTLEVIGTGIINDYEGTSNLYTYEGDGLLNTLVSGNLLYDIEGSIADPSETSTVFRVLEDGSLKKALISDDDVKPYIVVAKKSSSAAANYSSGEIASYSYYLSLYDEALDIESAPFKIGDFNIVTVDSNTKVLSPLYAYDPEGLGGDPTTKPHTDEMDINLSPMVGRGSHIRLYRIGGDLVDLTLDTEIPISDTAITYSSDNTDSQLTGNISTTFGKTIPDTISIIANSQLGLIGCVYETLFISENNGRSWNVLESVNVGSAIKGMYTTGGNLWIFTAARQLWVLQGASIEGLRLSMVSEDVGCSSHQTIASVGMNAIVWIDGGNIMYSSGNGVQNISSNRVNLEGKVLGNAIVDKGVYYLSTEDGIYKVDFNLPTIPISFLDISTIQEGNRPVYLQESIYKPSTTEIEPSKYKDNELISYNGSNLSIIKKLYAIIGYYKSPIFSIYTYDNGTNYQAINLVLKGTIALTVWIDGSKVIEGKSITTSSRSVVKEYIPNQKKLGFEIQVALELQEHAEVYSYTILYEAEATTE